MELLTRGIHISGSSAHWCYKLLAQGVICGSHRTEDPPGCLCSASATHERGNEGKWGQKPPKLPLYTWPDFKRLGSSPIQLWEKQAFSKTLRR